MIKRLIALTAAQKWMEVLTNELQTKPLPVLRSKGEIHAEAHTRAIHGKDSCCVHRVSGLLMLEQSQSRGSQSVEQEDIMIGDIIIAACIGIAVGVLLGVPWGVAICHSTLEDIEREKERENDGR